MRIWLVIAALCGGLGVVLGAFGAHALQTLEPRALDAWRTAASYQMVHALAIGLAALAMRYSRAWAARAATLFLTGIILFCGSLYVWALTGLHGLVFITPIGGLAFIIGWGLLAVAGGTLEEQ